MSVCEKCDSIPRVFGDILDKECEGMTEMEKAKAMRMVRVTLKFAREQYDSTSLALKNAEPNILGTDRTVRR